MKKQKQTKNNRKKLKLDPSKAIRKEKSVFSMKSQLNYGD